MSLGGGSAGNGRVARADSRSSRRLTGCEQNGMNVGKQTDRKREEGDEIRALEFKNTEYGRLTRVVASEEVKNDIRKIGINKCARESGFDRKNFIRKLIRDIPVKRNSYSEFLR
jgi:hypothetical protein